MIRLVFFLLFFSSLNAQDAILNIGHRGAKGHVAENTLASIQKAMELGADGIEIDVFRCFSGEIVVFHDKTLNKLTNGTGYIEKNTLSELKELKILGSTHSIPTLEEGSILISKFELLKAYAIGKYQNKESYIDALEKVAVGYPQTEQGKKALEIMKRLK